MQKVDPKDQKKNAQPTPKTEEELKKEEEEQRLREESKNAVTDDEVLNDQDQHRQRRRGRLRQEVGPDQSPGSKRNFAVFEERRQSSGSFAIL
ncbi:MAG: hypothetical protein IPK58_24170 [Acidobacteria bacterium]|nr:hypothetical protein [Acidobacteriota bacterium]